MVYNGKPYFLIDDLGGKPLFLETPIYWGYIGCFPSQGCGARFGEAYLETFGPLTWYAEWGDLWPCMCLDFLKGWVLKPVFFLGGGRCDVCFVPGTFGTSIEFNWWIGRRKRRKMLEIVSLWNMLTGLICIHVPPCLLMPFSTVGDNSDFRLDRLLGALHVFFCLGAVCISSSGTLYVLWPYLKK